MDCSQTYEALCPCLQKTVSISVWAEVDAGGYGCAISADWEYSCSLQSGCPHTGCVSCLLPPDSHI